MTINDQIRDEKLQYDINREVVKISVLPSGKIDKYFTGEEILPANQQQIIEQAKFTYSPLGAAFEKQIKTIDDHGIKQFKTLEKLKSKEQTKAIKNNQSRTTNIFNDLIIKRKKMSELCDSANMNKLYLSI